MNNIIKFTLVLFLVNLVAASILTGVYNVTKPKIEEQKKLLEKEALKEVMPEDVGDRLEPVDEGGAFKYWKVFKGSGYSPKGYVFIAKKYGYSSIIETMVGMKADGTITGVRILSQNETPGLGAKIVEVVSDNTIAKALKGVFSKQKEPEKKLSPYFTSQFVGLNVKRAELADEGIDAITGATISSRAVVDSIRSDGLEILNAK